MTVMTADGGTTGDADLDALTVEDPHNKAGGEDDDGLDIGALAKELGHVEKEKYRGKEEDWLPPERFVQKALKTASETRAIKRFQDELIKKQDKELAELKDLMRGVKETQSELVERQRNAEQRGYARLEADIEAEMDAAVADADTDRYQKSKARLAELRQAKATSAAKKAETGVDDKGKGADGPSGQNPGHHPYVREFLQDNSWARPGTAKHNWAVREEMNVGEELGLAGYENTQARLDELKKRAMERFPEMFENGARKQPSAVSRPAGGAGQRRKTKTVSDLPEDAKKSLAMIKKRDPKFTDEMYLKNYQWE